jgi:thiamine biosynthesis protein ThiS
METTETISIVVNGEAMKVRDSASVAQLLQVLGLHGGRVAIERNLQILPRPEWATTQVAAGDRYEIVQFVGGG